MKFLPYEPDQAWLLPPRVNDVLGEDHLCFFVHQVVERLDLSAFAAGYSGQGQRPYAPDRDRGGGCPPTPPTPPYVRSAYTAVP